MLAIVFTTLVYVLQFAALAIPRAHAAYTVSNSARFNDDDSAYLNKTPAGAGNRKIATVSLWFKPGSLGTARTLFAITPTSSGSDTNRITLQLNSSDKLTLSGHSTTWRTTTRVFRDPAAWTHIVLVWNTSSGNNSISLYIDGVQETAFDTSNSPTANTDYAFNNTTPHRIGAQYNIAGASTQEYLDGYLSDVYFIDGQALAPSDFGETDANGYWRAKAYSGSYGTNGFKLDFASGSDLGNDVSGNANDWTQNNMDVTDQEIDTPTNAFATLDPLLHGATHATLSNGNLRYTAAGGGANFELARGNQVMTTKTYWEWTVPAAVIYFYSGITDISRAAVRNGNAAIGYDATNYPKTFAYLSNNGNVYYNSSTPLATYSTAAAGDTLMFAYDPATGEVWLGNNGTWFNSGDPAGGTGEVATMDTSISYTPAVTDASSQSGYINFGQSKNATSTATTLTYSSAAGGYFMYTPPTGYKAISTSNLPEPVVTVPKNYFDAYIYSGANAQTAGSTDDGSAKTGLSFSPDLVWLKARNEGTLGHLLRDAVRGAKILISNLTDAEYNAAGTTLTSGYIKSLDPNGFTLGRGSGAVTPWRNVDESGYNYVAWAWKESPTSGFDIVTYTGNGANRTVSHSLNSAPEFFMVKRRDVGTREWTGWHTGIGDGTKYFGWSTTAAAAADATAWNSTVPSATTFSLGTFDGVNANGGTYVAYLWDEIPGFSKFGSYTGNGSADGPFVWTGFKPKFVIAKDVTGAVNYWIMLDGARNPYNPIDAGGLVANRADAESTTIYVDFLSSGFKVRNSGSNTNTSGSTYIYAAFADVPFKLSAAPAAAEASNAGATFLMGMEF